MGRLIELLPGDGAPPARLGLRVGDVLVVAATGGDVPSNPSALECLGAFRSGVVGGNGAVLSPEGPPDRVLFVGRAPGAAVLRVVTGDPWGARRSTLIEVHLEA